MESKSDFAEANSMWLAGTRWLQNELDRDINAGDFRSALLTLRLLESRLERVMEETTF